MFIFVLFNLILGLFLKNNSSFNFLLLSEYALYAGIVLLTVNFVATAIKFKKVPFALRYDLYAIGSVLVWISYWPPFFRVGSPVFYVFPLYFSFITALFYLLLMTNRERLSIEAINDLQLLADLWISNPLIVMSVVLISLAFPQHFMLYPIAITLFVIRFSLAYCVNNE